MKKLQLVVALVAVAITVSAQGRLPFQKKQIVLRSPPVYEQRVLRYDTKTGEPIYYDPKPRVLPLDLYARKYALRWIGYGGNEKTIVYERPDAINAVVSAFLSRTSSGQYIYTYRIQNLPSSKQQLAVFVVQTFGSDVKPIPIGDGYVGQMSSNKEMTNGKWVGFGSSNFAPAVIPGASIELKVISSEPPGLVECRIAGGQFGMIGVGEEPPQELENVLLGYEAWPRGYTIGPVQQLRSLSSAERVRYLLNNLSQFQNLGWIKNGVLGSYKRSLKNNSLQEIVRQAERDIKAGSITTELYGIISAMQVSNR